jgi:predicted DNA-binding transcriptional regulator YafY
MRDNRKLCISYKGHSMTEYKDMVIHPYSIRLFKRRWYLIAYSEYSKGIRLYMLDRTVSVNVLDEVFEMPEDFDAEGYFEDFYGVRRSEDDKQRVVLKVNAKNRDLVRTVALHRSQEEIETNDEYSVFEYLLRPNFDFKQEIISYLDSVEVLEPLSLRKEIGRMVLNVYMKYRKDVKNRNYGNQGSCKDYSE